MFDAEDIDNGWIRSSVRIVKTTCFTLRWGYVSLTTFGGLRGPSNGAINGIADAKRWYLDELEPFKGVYGRDIMKNITIQWELMEIGKWVLYG